MARYIVYLNGLCVLKKNEHRIVVRYSVSKVSIIARLLLPLSKSSASLLNFYLLFLSNIERGVLKYPSIIMNVCILLLEKEMAIQSSILAWRIPGTGEPGGLPSWGRTE